MRFSFADGIKVTLASDGFLGAAVELDYSKKRVYWSSYHMSNYHNIFSFDYDGKNMKAIASGPFNEYLLGVFRDSLYFLVKENLYHINQMNISNGNISHSIFVHKIDYYNLIVVDSSVQPMGKLRQTILECSVQLLQSVFSV